VTYPAQLCQVDQPLCILHLAIVIDSRLCQHKARVGTPNENARGKLNRSILLVDTHYCNDKTILWLVSMDNRSQMCD
jgi:hypothetical protein